MHVPIMIPPRPIQYADDTIIFTEAHPTMLRVLVQVLYIYGKMIGLKINGHEQLCAHSDTGPLVDTVRSIIGYMRAQLPITYLGLPLSAKRLTKMDFQPLVNSVRNRMES